MNKIIALLVTWNVIITLTLGIVAFDTQRKFDALAEYLQHQEAETKEAVLVLTRKVINLAQ